MSSEHAREDVGRAALRCRRDQTDRAGGVVLLSRSGSGEGETQREEEGAKGARKRTAAIHGASLRFGIVTEKRMPSVRRISLASRFKRVPPAPRRIWNRWLDFVA